MNRIYRLVWNRAKEAWVATAEIVHSKGGIPARTVGAVTGAALLHWEQGRHGLCPPEDRLLPVRRPYPS